MNRLNVKLKPNSTSEYTAVKIGTKEEEAEKYRLKLKEKKDA